MNTTGRTKSHLVAGARVAAADDRTRYDEFAILLHWALVVLVLTQFGLAELWDLAARSTKHTMIVSHMTCGILLLAVAILSIVWRLLPGHQVRPAATGLVEFAAKTVQFILYGLILVQGALGFALRWSGNEAMSFFGIAIPPPFPPTSKPTHELLGTVHDYVGWTIIILAAGHAAAALIHHFILRDDVLWRMLPGGHARRQESRRPSPENAAR